MQKQQVYARVEGENAYHFKLHSIVSRPYVLYRKGNIDLLDQSLLAIVGPRKCSPYSVQVTRELFSQLADYALVTISGGAMGIDRLTHELSIKQSIPTIVVL